jgi:hypothetical protein
VVVVQLTSAGADKWRDAIVAGLIQATGCSAVYERSDPTCAASKASAPRAASYGELPELLTIVENGVRMEVDVVSGHKTGFYLDQRENRLLTGQLAAGRDVLNCFCYTGGFSLQASPAAPRAWCRSIRPARRWPPPRATWRSTRSSTPAAPNGARTTSSRPCAPSRPRAASST